MAVKKYIILASILAFSVTVKADDVLNTFEAGEPIVASDVNENFVDLQNQINTLKTQLESQNSSDTRREFVGLTDIKTQGDAGGLFILNQMCASEYTGAKACKSDEVNGVDTSLLTGPSWIIPKIRLIIAQNQAFYYGIEDVKYPSGWSCNDWTSAGGSNNFSLKQNGRLEAIASCGSEKSVACCK